MIIAVPSATPVSVSLEPSDDTVNVAMASSEHALVMGSASPAASLKSGYLKRYGIPARMFNGVRVSLEGKVVSVREQQKLHMDSLGRRIARAQRQIAGAAEQGRWQQVHQKRRRLANLQSRLAALEDDIAQERVRLCFGSKRLWRKQRRLDKTAMPIIKNGCRTGRMRAAMSSSCWAAGTRRQVASCVWRAWLTMGP